MVGNVVAADAMMSGGDGQPETLAGVTVTLGGEHAMGETMETDETGGFAFTGLRAGTYTVTISDFPEDVSFEEVSLEISVEVGEVGQADFTGHFIRTSAVEGQVVIEGEGLAGVTVTLSGGPADESYTVLTDADGMYRFEDLRPGSYTVSISDFDTRDYEFASTSQDVSVDLDETGTVSFTGVLLRTSGIAGRVSVEGMGLGGIEVTLAGGDDSRTAMTDDGGQYNFAGLAAGDYTVSIAVDSDAYVFESMSADVTVGDDESAIVNFEGAHARTASVSGMVFIDELDKNDMFDEGEHPLARAGLPVALVGPGVNEQRLGATDATGAFSFDGLRSGPYQLVVLINAEVAAALSAADLAYGGPSEGYSMALGVGEAASQSIPFDITHTTVNFTVMLKSGDDTGDAVPGAMVTLYSDAAGETRVGGGETGDDGSVAIKVARAGTSGNMVHAGVAADGYTGEGMTAVSWDPQMFATAGSNDHDLVNLNVDAMVSGATVTTEYGGGDALAGWAISVMSGEDAVEGAPEMLDDDGNAALMATVASVPTTFTFAVADDQDDEMDGGESYEAEPVEYEHTGLSLAGTMDAGTIEVAYSTQTLRVYVHHERDQVPGFTENILAGDYRASGVLDLSVGYIDDAGRSRSFTSKEWNAAANTQKEDDVTLSSGAIIRGHGKAGLVVFSHLPADADVIVEASKADADAKLMVLNAGIHSDELAAYRDMDTNGVTGGAFGAMGGWSHTVELCPLQDEGRGDCGSFAYVNTHNVTGQAWKKDVIRTAGSDGFTVRDLRHVPGTTVTLDPVDGKNIAGDSESFTAAASNSRSTPHDDRKEFRFGQMAAGVYALGIPDGWRAAEGPPNATTGALGKEVNVDADLQIDVTPATGLIYGHVTGTNGFPLDSVTVTVNGVSAMTDGVGRYIVEGFDAVVGIDGRPTRTEFRNQKIVAISAARAGRVAAADTIMFAGLANNPTVHDIDLAGAQSRATISGTIRASGSNAPVAGVEIKVDGKAPLNAATSGANSGKLVTGADGTYTAIIAAKALGQTASVSATKRGMTFVPATLVAPAHPGAEITGIDFTGFLNATITGRVAGADGRPMDDVVVTATPVAGGDAVSTDTTGVTGVFSLNVPFGSYSLGFTAANHEFVIPPQYATAVNVAPGQVVNVGLVQARTFAASDVSAARVLTADDPGTTDNDESDPPTYTDTVRIAWSAGTVPTGHIVTYQAQSKVGDGAWTDLGSAVTSTALAATPATDSTVRTETVPTDSDGGFMVRVVSTSDNGTSGDTDDDVEIEGAAVDVAAVDPMATGVSARRQAAANSDEAATDGNFIQASWNALTNTNSAFRVVAQVTAANAGATVWVVLASGADSNARSAVSAEIGDTFSTPLPVALPSGTGASVTVTAAELRAAISIAVESVQGTADATDDGPKWKRSAAVTLAARTGS